MVQLSRISGLMANGATQHFPKGQVFYSLDFKEEFYLVKRGYVKRYQVVPDKKRVIESIYGPNYFFPLTQAYRTLLAFDLSQDDVTYIYEAMTDVDIVSIEVEAFKAAVEKDPGLYVDLFIEAGRRLKANINRLASNALTSDYKKVAHQLVCVAEEFSVVSNSDITIDVPLIARDMAEQLNITLASAQEAM